MLRSAARRFPAGLRLYVALSLLIAVPTWALALATASRRARYPMMDPFLNDGHTFLDFWIFQPRFLALHTERFFATGQTHFSYFAPAVPLYSAFYSLGPHAMVVYFAVVLAAMIAGAVLFGRTLVRAGLSRGSTAVFLTLSVLCAFPTIFALERGNMEAVLAIGVTAGVWAMSTGRRRLAAVLWGVFGGVKLYPLLLAGLFAARRRWFPLLLLTLVTAVAVTLVSLAYTGPTVAAARAGLHDGTSEFLQDFTLRMRATEWDHSAFAAIKVYARQHGHAVAPLLRPYFLIAGATMLLLYFWRIRRMPLANQIVVLSICMVLLPPTSFEYTLANLYGAWGLLVLMAVQAWAEGRRVPGLGASLGLMAVLFSPLKMVVWHGWSYGGQVQCVLLVALLVIALRDPWPALPGEPTAAARRHGRVRATLDIAGAHTAV